MDLSFTIISKEISTMIEQPMGKESDRHIERATDALYFWFDNKWIFRQITCHILTIFRDKAQSESRR